MTKASTRRLSAVLAVLTLLANLLSAPAMARGMLTDRDGVLAHVPDDSPYVFTSGEPIPDKVMDTLEPRFDEVLKAYQLFFREILSASITDKSTRKNPEEAQRFSAVVDELVNLMSIEGLRNAGFERGSNLVIYGHGLLPVLRIELGNVDKFEALIERLEAAAGESMETAELDGYAYRFVGDEEANVIIGVFDGDAVFTLAPTGLDGDDLKRLLGLTPLRQNIARSGKLLDLVKEYGFSEHYVGYFDVERLAQPFIGEATGIDTALLAAGDYDPAMLSDVCKAEIGDVLAVAPRLVIGYGEVSAEAISGSMVIEMRSDIAAGLMSLSAMVPGMGIDPGGLMSFAMSMNVPAMISFADARLTAMADDPYECEHFAEMQAGVASGREKLAQPLPPFITGLRGFNVIVDNLGDYDMTSGVPPTEVDASVVLSMDNAEAVFMMGAMMSPDLAAIDLQPNGKPVPLALPQLQAIAEFSYAAMIETALAVSLGSDAKSRVTTVLNAESADPPPFMSAAIDAGTYYTFVAESSMAEGKEGEDDSMPDAARIALRDAMLKIGEMYDRLLVDARFTARGIEIHSSTTLKN